MPTAEHLRGVVDAYVDGQNRNDREAVVALFAPDAELIDPVGAPAHHGADGIRAFWDSVRSLTEGDLTLHPKEVMVCGTEAAMVFEIHAGATGAGMRMTAVDIFEFDDDGKISRLKAYWDMEQGRPL